MDIRLGLTRRQRRQRGYSGRTTQATALALPSKPRPEWAGRAKPRYVVRHSQPDSIPGGVKTQWKPLERIDPHTSDWNLLVTLEGGGPGLLSPNGALIALSLFYGVEVWRVSDGTLLNELRGYGDWVKSVAFSRDGNLLALASPDGTVRLWCVSDGMLTRTLQGYMGCSHPVVFLPDGNPMVMEDCVPVRLYLIATETAAQ